MSDKRAIYRNYAIDNLAQLVRLNYAMTEATVKIAYQPNAGLLGLML